MKLIMIFSFMLVAGCLFIFNISATSKNCPQFERVLATIAKATEEDGGIEVEELKKIVEKCPPLVSRKVDRRVSKSPNLVIIHETRYESVSNHESPELKIIGEVEDENKPFVAIKSKGCCTVS